MAPRPQHPGLRELRATYLRDLRRLRRIARLPPAQIAELLGAERTARYELERAQLDRRIEAARRSAAVSVSDQWLATWLEAFRVRRPREYARLSTLGLASRLQREHRELAQYSPDWLRQRLAGLKEATPPATTSVPARQSGAA